MYTAKKPCNLRELLEKMRSHLDIAYDYDDVWGTETGSLAAVPAATAERIRLLPHDLIEELRKAVLDGSTRVIAKLIRRVRETGNIDCAQALQGLACRYDYDARCGCWERRQTDRVVGDAPVVRREGVLFLFMCPVGTRRRRADGDQPQMNRDKH